MSKVFLHKRFLQQKIQRDNTMAKWTHNNFDDTEEDPFEKKEKEPSEFELLLSNDTRTPPPRHNKTSSKKPGGNNSSAIDEAFESNTPIEAKVTKSNKGGFEATIGSRRCFIPMTQMDVVRIEDPEIYVGNTYSFLIIELKGQNIVLSRKALLKEEHENKIAKAKENLAEGQNYQATITRIVPFGAFASIDGIEGLIHINDLSERRVKKIEDVVKVGDVVTAKIIKIEQTPKFRMNLSLNDATERMTNEQKSSAQATESSMQGSLFSAAFDKANKRKK